MELHPAADSEFAAQVDYYEQEQAGLGIRFIPVSCGCSEKEDSIRRAPDAVREVILT